MFRAKVLSTEIRKKLLGFDVKLCYMYQEYTGWLYMKIRQQ